jgi:hypothetical protein
MKKLYRTLDCQQGTVFLKGILYVFPIPELTLISVFYCIFEVNFNRGVPRL